MENTYKINIKSKLQTMQKIVERLLNIEKIHQYTKEFEALVDVYLNINNQLNIKQTMEWEQQNTEFSNKLVYLMESIKTQDKKAIRENVNELEHSFFLWRSFVEKYCRYKVFIYGVNIYTPNMISAIDSEKAEIIAIVADQNQYLQQKIDQYEIISINEAIQEQFDYLISVSIVETTVEKLKGITLLKDHFIDYMSYKKFVMASPEFFLKMSELIEFNKPITGILTGLSYTQKGVDAPTLQGTFFNIANPSQDLYYDFEMFKYVYEKKQLKETLKYVIIGLSYYSFHYDLSLGIGRHRVNYYYPFVKKFHNAPEADQYLILHREIEELENKLLVSNHWIEIFKSERQNYEKMINDGYQNTYTLLNRSDEELLKDINTIKQDYKKNYPDTVKENKNILRRYLSFLDEINITPIVIVCPTTKLYQAFTPETFKNEFYNIINELQQDFNFKFFDFYSSQAFKDNDFYDVSHINKQGSKKLAVLLNSKLFIEN